MLPNLPLWFASAQDSAIALTNPSYLSVREFTGDADMAQRAATIQRNAVLLFGVEVTPVPNRVIRPVSTVGRDFVAVFHGEILALIGESIIIEVVAAMAGDSGIQRADIPLAVR